MDAITRTHLDNIHTKDKSLQDAAYNYLMRATELPVDWSYEAWEDLLADLRHKDNRARAIASQVLCNLAKSDPDQRMLTDFDALLTVTKDERFVTARHCLQALWKVGAAGAAQKEMVVRGLAGRYAECISEKNGLLIRYDILQGLRNLYEAVEDEGIRMQALTWIESEENLKYRKKYAKIWR